MRASAAQATRLLDRAAAWPERIWAVEGAGGLGHVLSMGISMTVPMVAWMLFRGHGWRNSTEMGAAMLVPAIRSSSSARSMFSRGDRRPAYT